MPVSKHHRQWVSKKHEVEQKVGDGGAEVSKSSRCRPGPVEATQAQLSHQTCITRVASGTWNAVQS